MLIITAKNFISLVLKIDGNVVDVVWEDNDSVKAIKVVKGDGVEYCNISDTLRQCHYYENNKTHPYYFLLTISKKRYIIYI